MRDCTVSHQVYLRRTEFANSHVFKSTKYCFLQYNVLQDAMIK